jgi:hypothetical protein
LAEGKHFWVIYGGAFNMISKWNIEAWNGKCHDHRD